MKRIATRPIRRAILSVALLRLLAYGSACLHHHGAPAVRPGGHSQHIATRGTIPPGFLDLVTTKKAFANRATVMPNGSPQVTPVWFDFDGKYHPPQFGTGTGEGQEHPPRSSRCALDPRLG